VRLFSTFFFFAAAARSFHTPPRTLAAIADAICVADVFSGFVLNLWIVSSSFLPEKGVLLLAAK
jgi:hypothetical protein